MSALVQINQVSIEVIAHGDTWAVSNKEVAESFGVTEATIRSQKSRGEFKEGVHFYVLQNATGNADQTMWTKKGVITLGFKLRETPKTIAFRDWASDYIITNQESVILPQLPQTYEEIMQNALLLASSKVEELKQKTLMLEHKIETDAPKVEFANRISSAVGSLTIQDFSKIISDKTNYVIGEKNLFKMLRSHGFLMSDNKPYQKYIDMGVLELKELSYTNQSTGDKVLYTKTKVTVKGQKYLIDRIDKIMESKSA